MGTLVDRLAAGLRGDIRCGAAVDAIAPGYRVGGVAVDAVVVTVPAPAAAALITDLAPAAAVALARVEYASVVLVTLAYDREDPLDGSGFLVPRGAGLTLTACSWTSSKWAHLGGDGLILRASAGRSGDDRAARMSDGEIVTRVRADLATTMGLHGPPAEVRVSRWPASFPQYAPGHLDRVDAIDAAMPPGLAVAGAALRGLGVPACIAQGRAAARRVYGP
jgi:oxygen-dependent protoporphyrinogen oxidase